MKLPAFFRTIGTTLAFLACASLAVAGGGTSLDEAQHAHATPVVHATLPPAAHAPIGDDAPGCPHGLARANNAHPARADFGAATGHATLPAAPDHRAEKREHGRPAPTTSLHAHRPLTQRSKGSLRNTPATPGMGLLLRMSTSAGRELSSLIDGVPCAPSTMRSGRAPPAATTPTNPARDPIACAAAHRPPLVTPQPSFAAVTPPTTTTTDDVLAACTPGRGFRAPSRRDAVLASALESEQVACSRAVRRKGATA
jgi:hypothetical protein